MSTCEGIALSPRERAILLGVLGRFADRIDRVGIFGSRVLGRSHPASDIDIVIYGAVNDAEIARIWSMFDQSSLAVTADIVRYDALGDGAFRRHIDRYAKSLFDQADLVTAAVS